MSIDPDVATTNQPYAFTKDNPLNAEDPLGLGAKEKVGKIGICIVFFCNNGLAQVGTAWQPKASRGEAPTEQAVKEKNGTEERREAEEQTSGQPVKGECIESRLLNNVGAALQSGLQSRAGKVAIGAAAVGAAGWVTYLAFGLIFA